MGLYRSLWASIGLYGALWGFMEVHGAPHNMQN